MLLHFRKMICLFSLVCSAMASSLLFAGIAEKWSVDTTSMTSHEITAYHGEALDLRCTLTSYGKMVMDPGTATFLWQTNGMGDAWWSTNANWGAGVATAKWRDAMDCGAGSYTYFIVIEVNGGLLYRINGSITMLDGPRGNARYLPIPTKIIDFSKVTVQNGDLSPFMQRSEIGSFATTNWVENQHYIAMDVTNGYDSVWANKFAYVVTNGFKVSVDMSITNGLAREEWVTNLVALATNGLAREEWVTNLVTTATNGLARESWVTNQHYIASDKTNGWDSAWATNFAYVVTNSLATTGYVNTAVASATPGDYLAVSNRAYAAPVAYSWSSPDEWMLTYTLGGSTVESVAGVGSSLNGYCIISNLETVTTYSESAQMSAETVDETSYYVPNVTKWTVSSGASISSAGLVTTDTDGPYRVTGEANGTVRVCDVLVQGNMVTKATNTFHAADVANSGTKVVNDAALVKLNAATKIGTYTREGKTYSVYNAEKVYITKTGAGNVSEFAVSAHILGTAAHYGTWIRWLGSQTFTAPDGATATVIKKQWYNLKDWALTNGWSAAEIEAAGVSDIALVVCDGATAVPDDCIPYFMSPVTAAEKYGDGQGIAAWKCSQFHDYALPVTLTNWRENIDGYAGNSVGYIADNVRYWVRADILSRLADMGAQNYVASGDSGKPTYIVDGSGRTIVVTANTSPNSGPDYVNGFYIIKAFVEAMGDTIKEAK